MSQPKLKHVTKVRNVKKKKIEYESRSLNILTLTSLHSSLLCFQYFVFFAIFPFYIFRSPTVENTDADSPTIAQKKFKFERRSNALLANWHLV